MRNRVRDGLVVRSGREILGYERVTIEQDHAWQKCMEEFCNWDTWGALPRYEPRP